MNIPINNKEELFPEDFTEDDKLNFDILLNQSKNLFPKLANDEWLLRMGILAYMKKEDLTHFFRMSFPNDSDKFNISE